MSEAGLRETAGLAGDKAERLSPERAARLVYKKITDQLPD
jgi:hypothetical protein